MRQDGITVTHKVKYSD